MHSPLRLLIKKGRQRYKPFLGIRYFFTHKNHMTLYIGTPTSKPMFRFRSSSCCFKTNIMKSPLEETYIATGWTGS